MKTTTTEIERLGWLVEHQDTHYRADQHGFKTLWRPTPEQVLKDVQAIKQARETCKAPF